MGRSIPSKATPAILNDFRNFLAVCWWHLELPDPTPVQYDIAHYLQHGDRRQIIEAFRGVGKSWITSAFVVWLLLRDPQVKIMVASASKARADDFSTFTLRLIYEMEMCRHLIPKHDQRESKIAFDVAPARASHAPSVKSAGIFGQITGSRAHHIIADDVEVPNNSMTQDMREKLLKTVMEFEAIIVPEGGRITYLGTPQTEESVYNSLREKGYEARIWPSRVPRVDMYSGALAPMIVDMMEVEEAKWEPTDPQRFNDQELFEREMAYGKSEFALQFMLDTSLSDQEKYPLKTSDLIVTNLSPESAAANIQYGSGPDQHLKELQNLGFAGDKWNMPMFYDKDKRIEYEGKAMFIDPSGRGVDELSYCILNQCQGKLFLLKVGGLRGGYTDENMLLLAKTAKFYGVHIVQTESNFGDGMFEKILTPVLNQYHKCKIEEVRHNKQKELRIIETMEPVMNQHRLIVDRSVIEEDMKVAQADRNYSLFYQMTRMCKERGALRHDDRIDVVAMGVAYWVEAMARDENKAYNDHLDDLWKKEMEVHLANLVNSPVTSGRSANSKRLDTRGFSMR